MENVFHVYLIRGSQKYARKHILTMLNVENTFCGILTFHKHTMDQVDIAKQDLRVRRYGYAMLVPILIMTIFTLRQWWRLEKSWNRLWTLPLVVFQFFPQYRALRILYLGLWKKASWRKEKDLYDRDLNSLGMYVLKYLRL